MPSYSPTLLAEPNVPWMVFSEHDVLEPEYCVGNSHTLVVAEFDDGTAECECGGLLRPPREGERQVELVHDTTGRQHCPPYGCRACCRVHNQPAGAQRYTAAQLALMGPHAMRRAAESAQADLDNDAVTYLGMDRAQTRATASRAVAKIMAMLDRTVS